MSRCPFCLGYGVADLTDPEGAPCPACDSRPCASCLNTGVVDIGCWDNSPDCCGECPIEPVPCTCITDKEGST